MMNVLIGRNVRVSLFLGCHLQLSDGTFRLVDFKRELLDRIELWSSRLVGGLFDFVISNCPLSLMRLHLTDSENGFIEVKQILPQQLLGRDVYVPI